MLTFLFWNLNRRDRLANIVRLATRHTIDVLLLAECDITPAEMLTSLNQKQGDAFHFHPSPSGYDRVFVYSRFAGQFVRPVRDNDHTTMRNLELPQRAPLLLVATHLGSKLHQSTESQALACSDLASRIREAEAQVGHERTIVVGDLNMNPFEAGVVGAAGLHAVMDRRVTAKGSRIVSGTAYPLFYNPMWSRMGDDSSGPPGTYYRSSAEHVCFFWNTFDQVLLRPDLLPMFSKQGLKVLEGDGVIRFVKSDGTPDPAAASDHLPLLFRLDL